MDARAFSRARHPSALPPADAGQLVPDRRAVGLVAQADDGEHRELLEVYR